MQTRKPASHPRRGSFPSNPRTSARPPALALTLAFACLIALFPIPVAAQAFGGALLVADGRILVGEAAHQREPGTVRAYTLEGGDRREVARLQGPGATARDRFGKSLARAGEFLLVGAGGGAEGRVHVYRLAALGSADAAPVQTLSPPGWTGFGDALAGSETEFVTMATDPEGERVLVVFRPGADGTWSQTETLPVGPADGTGAVRFVLSGDLLVVGDAASGVVHVFEKGSAGAWVSPVALERPGPEDGSARFGIAIALHGREVLVGERSVRGDDSGGGTVRTGAVHRFARIDGPWTPVGVLSPGEGRNPAGFGSSMATHGNTLLVGGEGLVFVYTRETEDWTLTDTVLPSATGEGERPPSFRTVALGDGLAVLGDPAADFGLGAVSVLSGESGGWMPAGVLVADHAPLPSVSGAEVACEEGGAAAYDCHNVDLLAFLPREELGAGRGARLNDVWGWTDPETGREYGLVGRMDGTAFVDVTDPYNPRYLGNLPKTEGSRANTWRDIKVYEDHAFVVADGAGAHGMQIFDLTRLRDVTGPREFEATALYTGVESVHNVAINEQTGFAYLVGSSGGGETCGGGSHIVDIRDPLDPVFAGCFAHPNTGRTNTGNSHDTQCVIYHGPDQDYQDHEICINSNETALSVADVTDKENPVAVAKADYPKVAYAHQGWLTEDHRHFYSNDELDELGGLVEASRTLIWDLQDLDDPLLLGEYLSPTRATDHNLYVRGDRLYMSNNRAGLRVLDIRDRENPVEVGYFDTTPWSADEPGFDGTWSVYPYFASGTVLLSSRREGLFLVRPGEGRTTP